MTNKSKFNKKFPLGGETWVLKRHRDEVWELVEQVLKEQKKFYEAKIKMLENPHEAYE